MIRTITQDPMRILIAVLLLCILWEPIRPIRTVTADALDVMETWIRD